MISWEDLKKKKIDGLKIVDVASTILKLMGLSVPKDFEGKSIMD